MNKIEAKLRCLELSCSIARDTGYLEAYRWDKMTNQERSDVFSNILKMASDFSKFVDTETE